MTGMREFGAQHVRLLVAETEGGGTGRKTKWPARRQAVEELVARARNLTRLRVK